MRIGLTYDLREEYRRQGLSEEATAEFDSLETIEAIEAALVALGHDPIRIGTLPRLNARLATGERWDLVFNIAEGLHGFGREAQVPALLDAFAIPYTFSDPLVLALALHKALTKHVVRDLGIPTPAFAVVRTDDDLPRVDLPFPVFAKPVAGGTSVGISSASVVRERRGLGPMCRDLLARFGQPVLLETFLPGRELSVGIVGTGHDARALGVLEIRLTGDAEPDAYSYANKQQYETQVRYGLASDRAADDATALALRVWRELGCRDGGRVDFRCDATGAVQFLEVNPLAGLHPVHSDLVILCRLRGLPYEQLIAAIVASAAERTRTPAAAPSRHPIDTGAD